LGVEVKVGGVYAATQGPRLETAAEINRLARDGVDLVGMTGMPEAALARELGLPYAAINVVANHAAGRGTSANGIHFESLDVVLQGAMGRVRSIIEKLVGCQSCGQ
jgi:5'-methylthioadenosine phosphorylase